MPDLSNEATHEFWSEYQDPLIYRVIAFMEGIEAWTLDGHYQIEEALHKLGNEFDDIANIDMNELGHEETIINVCNYLKTGRVLRILQAIDSVHPGSASKVLIHAEDNSHGVDSAYGLFLRRNIIFERLRLLSRVFSKDRFSLVLKALEGEDNA